MHRTELAGSGGRRRAAAAAARHRPHATCRASRTASARSCTARSSPRDPRRAARAPQELIATFGAPAQPRVADRAGELREARAARRTSCASATSSPSACPVRGTARCARSRSRRRASASSRSTGHLEAGRIRFSARDAGPGRLQVTHRDVGARRRPPLQPAVRPPARQQGGPAAHVDVGARAAHASCRAGAATGWSTSRRGASTPTSSPVLDEQLAATPRAQRALAELTGRPLNFDPAELERAGPESGWRIDDYRQPLPAEPPGPPVAGGSFEVAQRLMADYAFADPAIVRAVFDPASELADRNMLLQARFGPLRLLLRLPRRHDHRRDARRSTGAQVRVWGWSYGTLAGHVERGQMRLGRLEVARRRSGRVSHPRRLAPRDGAQPVRAPRLPARRPQAGRCASPSAPASGWRELVARETSRTAAQRFVMSAARRNCVLSAARLRSSAPSATRDERHLARGAPRRAAPRRAAGHALHARRGAAQPPPERLAAAPSASCRGRSSGAGARARSSPPRRRGPWRRTR